MCLFPFKTIGISLVHSVVLVQISICIPCFLIKHKLCLLALKVLQSIVLSYEPNPLLQGQLKSGLCQLQQPHPIYSRKPFSAPAH